MLKIKGNDIYRSSEKVGYIEEHRILSHAGKKLGYFDGTHIYGNDGDKVGYISGNYLYSEGDGSSERVSLDEVNENIVGGLLPQIGKCAVYMLIGA
jgi:hypothetical protein